jgi:HK97 gp10 family phage protein
MSFSFKIVKYGDKFRQMERKAKPEAARIASETAQNAASLAKQLAPEDTGALKESIFIEQLSETRFKVGAAVPYAGFVENGTVFQDAQPFLRPAIEFARKDFEAALQSFFASVSA